MIAAVRHTKRIAGDTMERLLFGFFALAFMSFPNTAYAESLKIITIAAMYPRSGLLQNFGDSLFNGTQLAFLEAKTEFQKMGFDLRLKSFDDTGSSVVGEKLAKNLVDDPSILAIVGPAISDIAIPVLAILAPYKITMVTIAGNSQITDRNLPNINRITARDDAQGLVGVKMIAEVLQAQNVFIVDDASVFGKEFSSSAIKYFKKTTIKILGSINTEEKTDFSNLTAKIQKISPNIIYFGGNYNIAIPLIR
jgi:branched-chain amino acid transport system substrate-binding protein